MCLREQACRFGPGKFNSDIKHLRAYGAKAYIHRVGKGCDGPTAREIEGRAMEQCNGLVRKNIVGWSDPTVAMLTALFA